MESKIVLALDPGGTSGYAWGEIGSDDIFRYRGAGQSRMGRAGLWAMLESVSPAYLIAESFESRQGIVGVELVSRNLLGVCQLWAEIRDTNYSEQSPGEGKGFYADAKLQKAGVWIPGNIHANDASRHLLHWATFKEGARWLGNNARPVIQLTG